MTRPDDGRDAPGAATESEEAVEEAAEAVEADLDRLASERDELRAMAQRLQADFENFRKQSIRRETEVVERANARLVEELLPVLDSFELAMANLPADVDAKVRKGVELLYAELLGVLEKAGLARVETDGAAFDPNVHEAVMHDEGDGDPVVAETLRAGFRFKDRVLRPAMVKVSRHIVTRVRKES